MVGEVFAGISAFNSMFSIAKSIKDMNDVAIRNAAVSELWEQIFTAQSRYSEAIEQIRALETKLSSFEKWDTEKQRYKLTDFGGGTFAYLLKKEAANGEPPHRICANCYQQGDKSILLFLHRSHNQDYYKCHKCGEQTFGTYVAPQSDFYGDEPDSGGFMTS